MDHLCDVKKMLRGYVLFVFIVNSIYFNFFFFYDFIKFESLDDDE